MRWRPYDVFYAGGNVGACGFYDNEDDPIMSEVKGKGALR